MSSLENNAGTIETLAVLVELDDHTVRQVYLNRHEIDAVKNLLNILHNGVVKVSKEVLAVELSEKEGE